jgi:hypothetical protein
MCNLCWITKGQSAIRDLFRVVHDKTGNLPPLPGIFADYRRQSCACPAASARWRWRFGESRARSSSSRARPPIRVSPTSACVVAALVSAWASRQRLVLGQEAVDKKSNEIVAIPLLLEHLELEGALVTIDAVGR